MLHLLMSIISTAYIFGATAISFHPSDETVSKVVRKIVPLVPKQVWNGLYARDNEGLCIRFLAPCFKHDHPLLEGPYNAIIGSPFNKTSRKFLEVFLDTEQREDHLSFALLKFFAYLGKKFVPRISSFNPVHTWVQVEIDKLNLPDDIDLETMEYPLLSKLSPIFSNFPWLIQSPLPEMADCDNKPLPEILADFLADCLIKSTAAFLAIHPPCFKPSQNFHWRHSHAPQNLDLYLSHLSQSITTESETLRQALSQKMAAKVSSFKNQVTQIHFDSNSPTLDFLSLGDPLDLYINERMTALDSKRFEVYCGFTEECSGYRGETTSLILARDVNYEEADQWQFPVIIYSLELFSGNPTFEHCSIHDLRAQLSDDSVMRCLDLFKKLILLPDSRLPSSSKKQFETEITLLEKESSPAQ